MTAPPPAPDAPDPKTRALVGAALGAVTAVPVMGLDYLAMRLWDVPFVPFDVFDWLARMLPGPLITHVIDLMVAVIRGLHLGPTASTAKLAEQAQGLVLVAVTGAVVGAVLALLPQGRLGAVWPGLIAGAVLLLGMVPVERTIGFPGAGVYASMAWLALLLGGWGALLGWLQGAAHRGLAGGPDTTPSRRQFLYLVGGGSILVAVGSVSLARLLESAGSAPPSSETLPAPSATDTGGPAASPPEDVLATRMAPAAGTRPELTSTKDFYRVDINAVPPQVDAAKWTLKVDGLVAQPLALTLDDLRAMPSVSQVITLECISNPVGGDLISTGMYTGVRLKDVLDRAGVLDSAVEAYVTCADGFYESIVMADIQDPRTLLVYDLNGAPLTAAHGFPLRSYVPNRYGMKQPKWIEHIELSDRHTPGYWVDRGWDDQAIVRETSVVDAADTRAAGSGSAAVPIGGIAYAGARGISKVEVQIDDGPWVEAGLRQPALSPLSWTQWRYDWPYTSGRHTVRVRAYDGDGHVQDAQSEPPSPRGASGIDRLVFDV